MNNSKYVFAQLTVFLDRNHFNYLVRKYEGNKYVKHFTCWNQLLAMMFGQLSNRESLRDLVVAIEAHRNKCYHLGFGKNVSKTSLARANQTRDFRIFEEFAYYLVSEARDKRKTDIFNLDGNVYAFDSTTISLCLEVFWWAKFSKYKGGIKIRTLYDLETQIPAFFHITTASVYDSKVMKEIPIESGAYYIFDRGYNNFKELYRIQCMGSFFVVRAKSNLQYKCIKWKRRLPDGILTDAEIKLTSLQIADLYKNRWQIELFFKWLKQHLKIKKFWGTTENAVRIQIYSAICAYCLVAIIQHDLHLKRSTYELLQILSMSLTDTTPLKDLFNKTIFKNDKERFGFNEPTLFDNLD